ncbi:NAD dependent epimerase/dehydratase family protein [Stieleria maiorica]|uniref:NAD dependent epimerase/dehydratase family protein n=1 Tax=Stieleria maiorica TaxID=2795974 RepID=A0A5B9MAR8_9BACT|nr:NAD(P)-dependent oxidoreductase [Stieleria maiorica]QEF96615.1 NAD dependent epimerase/dehydratase family protein [Stieleria maiorica]
MTTTAGLPDRIEDESQLETLLVAPSAELVEFAASLSGPIVVLGAGGKMGPTLAARAQAAIDQAGADAHVVAVSRFSDPAAREWLKGYGVQTIAADLLCQDSLSQLPDANTIVYLVGSKFGTRQNPSHTWAVNTIAPALAMQRYPTSTFVALSTGNVYPFSPIDRGGSLESDPLAPVGEYAYAAVGRERIFDHFSRQDGTPVAMIRLNYATDLRYGVLTDLATKVARGETIDLAQGYFNCIWQGDANDLILRALPLAESPPRPINLTSVETFSVREVATRFAELMNCSVRFSGQESETALLSNASQCSELLGAPATPMQQVIRWTADWVQHGGRLLGKPTHFEVRDGAF